jgi:hypothetical protein
VQRTKQVEDESEALALIVTMDLQPRLPHSFPYWRLHSALLLAELGDAWLLLVMLSKNA